MIPKKIHYCWFGGKPLTKTAKKCIKSWKKYFPDYEIIEWNETNFDINFNEYAKQAYDSKKWAFFTDVARLFIIYNNGGIYFDVDVEVIKSYSDIINCLAFFGVESNGLVNTGLGFGAEKKNPFIKKLLDDYKNKKFINKDGTLNLTSCPIINSKIFKKYGFKLNNCNESIDGIYVYSKEYFSPLEIGTGIVKKNNNTHSIHWYKATWQTPLVRLRIIFLRPLRRLIGMKNYNKIKIKIQNKK